MHHQYESAILFFLLHERGSPIRSLRATEMMWSFLFLLVLLSIYTLFSASTHSHDESSHSFISSWLSLLSLLLIHHISSACAEKCEFFTRKDSNKGFRLHRLPIVVRFGAAVFLLAGLSMEMGHLLPSLLSHSVAMDERNPRDEGRGMTIDTMRSTAEREVKPDGALSTHSLEGVEGLHSTVMSSSSPSSASFKEGTAFSVGTPLSLNTTSMYSLQGLSFTIWRDSAVPMLLMLVYILLLVFFRESVDRMDAVVGCAEEELRVKLPHSEELSRKGFQDRTREGKQDSSSRMRFSLLRSGSSGSSKGHTVSSLPSFLRLVFPSMVWRSKSMASFLRNVKAFVFPFAMLLSCLSCPFLQGSLGVFFEALIVMGTAGGLAARTVYACTPMLRFLMNQCVCAGSPSCSKEVAHMLTETVSSIPGVMEMTRYAWWKVAKYEDHRLFLQLKISRDGDPLSISSKVRKCLGSLLQAEVYVECEQEGGAMNSVVVLDDRHGISTPPDKVDEQGEEHEKDVQKMNEQKHSGAYLNSATNFSLNIPFHQPHRDSLLVRTLHSHERVHGFHAHSHGCCH